eukprot:TRINITY_DN771_c0_g1_i1.p1 TRINITY_DN771_c0_g1~~TRINITY_DN771_c0_g1_i1.p1  ORF type:complete len:439 (-),score=86.30 TRINITY_DN771_c0_g1_i1:87-1403(-)
MKMLSIIVLAAMLFGITEASAYNHLARRPLMGWSTWNLCAIKDHPLYGLNWLNSSNVIHQSDAMKSKLSKFGFEYINIDSYWANDPDQIVDHYGREVPDHSRWPQGLPAVIDHIHRNGQKVGLYINPGLPKAALTKNTPIEGTSCHAKDIVFIPLTNGNAFGGNWKLNFSHPCAMDWVRSEARMFAEWGVDFLKMDAVSPGSWNNQIDCRPDVAAWAEALNETGRPIWLELSWSLDITYIDFWKKYSNGWRIDGDVDCYCNTLVSWNSVQTRFKDVVPFLPHGAPGGWNDLDSIVVGNAEELNGLNDVEKRTTVTLWAITCAQWYLGGDLTLYEEYGISLISHQEILKINQAGIPAYPLAAYSGTQQVWNARYPDHHHILAFFNLEEQEWEMTFPFKELGIEQKVHVRNVWTDKDLGLLSEVAGTIPPHGTMLFHLTP